MTHQIINEISHDGSPLQIPFEAVADAWFWFIRCQKMRNDGVKYRPSTQLTSRPCEPVDVYCTARRLHQMKRLSNEHLRVLARFGILECPPDPRNRSEQRDAILWDEALERMLGPLCMKGIVSVPGDPGLSSGYTHAK